MARGWESKAIESQQDDADRGRLREAASPLTPAAAEALERRKGLELARARLLSDLSRATRAAHRAGLERSLAALDEQLRGMDQTT